jgi:hypothetical protein
MDDVRPKVLLEKHWRGGKNFWPTGFITALQTCIGKKIKRLLQARRLLKEQPLAKNLFVALKVLSNEN